MRIVQLIDTLEPGGAEKMAVTLANALLEKTDFSALAVTRKTGELHDLLSDNVNFIFLDKKKTIDIRAALKFKFFLKSNSIDIIHAHGTSAFFSVLTKLLYPRVRIIWHDHNGNRVSEGNKNLIYKILSYFFSSVFVVNEQQLSYVKHHFSSKYFFLVPNFISLDDFQIRKTTLKGEEGKRIVCLANLRNPKNHVLLLKAFYESGIIDLGWTLHLVGKDFEDLYSEKVHKFIQQSNLNDSVFIYNSCVDVDYILNQANVGVLASTHEGFPVSLLEYGKHKLAVISSNVGYCDTLIENDVNGLIFESQNKKDLINKIKKITLDLQLRMFLSDNLYQKVIENYSTNAVTESLMIQYRKALEN